MSISILPKGLLFLCCILVVQYAHGYLLEVNKYAESISQRLVDGIETGEVTGKSMPLNDFDNRLHFHDSGIVVDGQIHYHSGFVKKFKSVNWYGDVGAVTATESYVHFVFQLLGLSIVYDTSYDLKDYKGHGIVEINMPILIFTVDIVKPHSTRITKGKIEFLTTGTQNDFDTRVFPENGYTQFCTRELRRNGTYREEIMSSFEGWSRSWQIFVDDAIQKTEFPKTCYDCHKKKKKPKA